MVAQTPTWRHKTFASRRLFNKMRLSNRKIRFGCGFLLLYVIIQIIYLKFFKPDNVSHEGFKIFSLFKRIVSQLNDDSILDNSGLYKYIKMKQFKGSNGRDITLVSQCSFNHLNDIDDLFREWKGPISVAIYAELQYFDRSVWDIARFMYCNSDRDFSMQLIVPAENKYEWRLSFVKESIDLAEKTLMCTSNYNTVRLQNYNLTSDYPVNFLRNVARSSVTTDFLFVVDIDMIPSRNLRKEFLNFVKDSDAEKSLYVVPVFETLPGVSMPRNKTELVKLVNLKKARAFYVVPCEACQKLTRYDEWLANDELSDVKVLWKVEWKHPWEPFFIGKSTMPGFDERFRQYGMNRVSQIYELFMADYEFLVLSNVFLIHRGFKTLTDFHQSKENDMKRNRRIYNRFKIEMKYKYSKP